MYNSNLLCRCFTTTTCNLLVSRFMEDVKKKNTTIFTYSASYFLQNQRPEKNSPTFDKLRVMKFETVWIRFLSDVSTAVAIVVA